VSIRRATDLSVAQLMEDIGLQYCLLHAVCDGALSRWRRRDIENLSSAVCQ